MTAQGSSDSVMVEGYFGYNTGERREERILRVTADQIVTDGCAYERGTGKPFTMNFAGYRIPPEELARLEAAWVVQGEPVLR